MGEIKSTNEKKKSQLRFNVGGGVALVGVVLLGGGLAVAGLMAAFSFIKNRNSGKYYNKIEDSPSPEAAAAAATTPSWKKHDGSPGLSFVHQNLSTSVHQNSCCTNHGTAKIGVTESLMDSKELVSAQNMSLGDKTLPIMDGGKEIVVSDDLNKEISESYNEILINEESSLPAPESMIKNNSNENLQLMDNIEVEKEEEHADTEKMAVEENLYRQSVKEEEDDADNDIDVSEEHVIEKEEEIAEGELAPKENLPTHSVAEEEEGDDDDDDNDEDSVDNDDCSEDVTEKEEECSEETGSSSMESNVEAIWPTEMIEGLSKELEEMNANNQNSGEKKIAKPECYDHLNCKNDGNRFNEHASNNETTKNSVMLNEKHTQDLVMEKVENTHLPRPEVFVWSLLAILLLLLLLNIHRTALVNDLSHQKRV